MTALDQSAGQASPADRFARTSAAVDVSIVGEVIDDLVGGLIGGEIGERLGTGIRSRVHGRTVRSVAQRQRGSTRATLVRPGGAWPRYWYGALVRSDDRLCWRPLVRRWRTVDLGPAAVVGWSTTESFWRGRYLLVDLARVDPVRQLRLTQDRMEVVQALFGDDRWLVTPRRSGRRDS